MSNYQSSFHVIDLKLDIEPLLLQWTKLATHQFLARVKIVRSQLIVW